MMTPPPTDWGFLRAWFRALAPWLEYREWPDVEKRSLRSRLRALRVYLTKPEEQVQETPRETTARLVKLREALELVGLALYYDHTAWGQFDVVEPRPAEYKHWKRFGIADDLAPRFELAFDVSHEEQLFQTFWRVEEADVFAWDMHLCERLLVLKPSELSSAYHAAKSRLRTIVGSAFDTLYRIELQFVFMPPRQPTTSYVRQLHRFIASIYDDSSPCNQVFSLRLMHAYLHSLPYTVEMAQFFEFVRGSGIQLAMAGVGARDEHADELAMERVVAATMAMETERVVHREPQMMVVHKSDTKLFESICRQLATGTRIDHLVLENAFRDVHKLEKQQSETKWKLLGKALSDPECARPLKVLSIAAMLTIQDDHVHILQEAMQTPRQRVLRTVELSSEAEVRFPTGQVVLARSISDGLCTFQVVDDGNDGDDGEHMKVLVPDAGVCIVNCSDVVDATIESVTCTPKSTLDTLDIGCGDCSAAAVMRLMNCFGSSLRQLSLHIYFDPSIPPATWTSIFRACPLLEHLALADFPLPNLNVVINAFSRHETRLRLLSLRNTKTEDASLARFVRKLSDRSHPIAQTLQQFRYVDAKIRNKKAGSNRPTPATVRAFLAMLEVNKTLEFLELGLVPSLYNVYADKFRVFEHERLPSLTMPAKLALLSVLRSRGRDAEPSTKRLARDHRIPYHSRRETKRVAPCVWEFAAGPLRREVSLVEITEIEE